jgi:hypothetical protein
MTIGLMKIEALKLLYLNPRDIHEADLTQLGANQNYSDYLAAMPGCINRAQQDIITRRILPLRVYTIPPKAKTVDLSEITDLYAIQRISFESAFSYDKKISYEREGDKVMLLDGAPDGIYKIIYYPKVAPIRAETPDDYEPDIPEPVAAAIPYFIKAELLNMDGGANSQEVVQARNMYETALTRYQQANREAHAGRVKNVFTRMLGGW